jgi:integration host factor subunit alpha
MKLASELSQKLGFSEIQIEKTLDGLRSHVAEQLSQGQKVVLPEFLIFDFKDKGERMRRNPRTGEQILVAPNRAPKTRFSQKFEEAITLPIPIPPPLPVMPPPLPSKGQEKTYHLADGSQRGESEVKTLPPDTLIWHPEFGSNWRRVGAFFP